MKSSKCLALIFLFFIVAAIPIDAKAQSRLINKITLQWAIGQKLKALPADIKQQFKQNPFKLSDSANKKLMHKFDNAYADKKLINDFKHALQDTLQKASINDLSKWLDRPAIDTTTNARRAYYTLQGKRQRVITMYKLDQNSVSQRRLALIDSVSTATFIDDNSVASSVIIIRSIIKGLNYLSTKRNFTDTQIQTIIKNFKAQLQASTPQQNRDELMMIFYNTTLRNLHKYVAFLQSDAGQHLSAAINQSMQKAYQAAADRFLQAVVQG